MSSSLTQWFKSLTEGYEQFNRIQQGRAYLGHIKSEHEYLMFKGIKIKEPNFMACNFDFINIGLPCCIRYVLQTFEANVC